MKALTRKDDVVRRASVVYGEDPTLWVHEFRYRTRGHKHRWQDILAGYNAGKRVDDVAEDILIRGLGVKA